MRRFILIFPLALLLCGQSNGAEPPELRRHPALIAYLTASADTLSTSSDPRELWVAARLLKQVEHWTLPLDGTEMLNGNEASTRRARRRDELMTRALTLGAKDPMLAWIAQSGVYCPASPSVCREAEALARLRALAPSNAASWWTMAGLDPERPETADVLQQRLERIASASRFDTYDSERLLTFLRGLERTPVPPELLKGTTGVSPPTAASVRAGIAFEIQAVQDSLVQFDRQILVFCTAPDSDDARRSLCEQVGRVSMEKAGNPLDHRLGARLLLALLPEGDARNTVIRQARIESWQQDQLLDLMPDDSTSAQWVQRQVDCLIQPGATELGCARRFIAQSGRPLDPPPNWRSRWESLPVGQRFPPDSSSRE
jgi:hypothetical protein